MDGVDKLVQGVGKAIDKVPEVYEIWKHGSNTQPTQNHEPAVRFLYGSENCHEKQPHFPSGSSLSRSQ